MAEASRSGGSGQGLRGRSMGVGFPGNATLPSGIEKRANQDRDPKRDESRLGTQIGVPGIPDPVPARAVEDIHGQEARDTHGRDAHATEPPEGGTPNNEVSSLKCEVTREENETANPASSPTSHFPLHTAVAAGETRPGEVSSGKCPVASEQGRVSGPLSLPTSNFTLPTPGETPCGEMCETNPICAGPNEGQIPCGAGVRNDSPQDEICETKPMQDGMSLGKEDAEEHVMSGNAL